MLEEFNFTNCNPHKGSMIENLKLTNETCILIVDTILYQHKVDKLIYLTNICPYLIFTISVMSRHMAIPQETHLDVSFTYFQGYYKFWNTIFERV
jgi:hypothetical protein